MGVYVPGMEIPTSAFNCSTKINPDERRCNFTGKVFEETFSLITTRRCKDCPLVEVPTPHGRLIDAEALKAAIHEHDYYLKDMFNSTGHGMFTFGIEQVISEAPAIIEAEEV